MTPKEPTRTLVHDLESAADVLALRPADDIRPLLDSTLGTRLRSAAARLREEMAHWDRFPGTQVGDVLVKINGGPRT